MAAQLAIKVLSFGFSVLVVRHLGATAYGQYAAVLAFGAVFVFLGDLGLSPFTVREVARWRGQPDGSSRVNELYGDILTLRLVLSVAAAVLLITAAWLTGRPLVMVGAIALGSLGLLMYGVQGTSDSFLAGFERLDLSAGNKVLQQSAFVVVGGLALWLGFGYYGLVLANLLGVAILTISCWRGARRLGVRAVRTSMAVWPSLLRASLPFGVIGFALGLSYKFDSILLNIFRGDLETGYYNAAYNLIFSTVVLSNVVNSALYPSLARQASTNSEALPPIYQRALRYLVLLSLPIAIGVFVLAGQLIPFLYTAAYQPAVAVLQILIWVVPFMFISEFLGYIVVIGGKEKQVARAVIVSTLANVAANLVLVPWLGLFGASVMTVLTEVILVGQYLWHLRAMLRHFDWGYIVVRPVVAAAAMGSLMFLGRGLSLPTEIALGAVAYFGLLLVLGVVGKEELAFLTMSRRSVVPVGATFD